MDASAKGVEDGPGAAAVAAESFRWAPIFSKQYNPKKLSPRFRPWSHLRGICNRSFYAATGIALLRARFAAAAVIAGGAC